MIRISTKSCKVSVLQIILILVLGKEISVSASDSELENAGLPPADVPPPVPSPQLEQKLTSDDEDYETVNSTSTSENSSDWRMSVHKGIIDFMSLKVEQVLELSRSKALTEIATSRKNGDDENDSFERNGGRNNIYNVRKYNMLNVTYFNPLYEYLELSKKIMQKTCPPSYVVPGFLDVSVSTFIGLQQNKFKFPEFTYESSEAIRRIFYTMQSCEKNATAFNFTPPDCNGKVDGKYVLPNSSISEMTITADLIDLDRDPIVETVWKIFLNAHNYCTSVFTNRLDFGRFTTWMSRLFQNEINDMWTQGKTTENSLKRLFGNQIIVQRNLGYCVASSRLVSGYPDLHDLPRPFKINEFQDISRLEQMV